MGTDCTSGDTCAVDSGASVSVVALVLLAGGGISTTRLVTTGTLNDEETVLVSCGGRDAIRFVSIAEGSGAGLNFACS